jgi:hypothetical protein
LQYSVYILQKRDSNNSQSVTGILSILHIPTSRYYRMTIKMTSIILFSRKLLLSINFVSRLRFILYNQDLRIYPTKSGLSLIYMLIWTGFLETRLYISSLLPLYSHANRIISLWETLRSLKFDGISRL